MKLLTLNTHSLVESDYRKKLSCFINAIAKEKPDIIALQEVNQTAKEENAVTDRFYFPCCDAKITKDNHVMNVALGLSQLGTEYFWTYLPIKMGYDKYDEGLAVMSLSPITKTDMLTVSRTDDYNNWKTRKILGIATEDYNNKLFYSVHMGWWDDEKEPFETQWQKINSHFKSNEQVWLMGDFNCPADARNEGYDLVSESFFDCYKTAEKKDSGITVPGAIDGWREKDRLNRGMRLDYIWCSENVKVNSHRVIFSGVQYPVISDHYGIVAEFDDEADSDNSTGSDKLNI